MLAIADRWTKQPQRLVGAADDWDLLWSASAAPVNQVNNQTAAPVAPNKPGVAGVWTDYQSTSAVQTFAVPATSTYTLFVVLCQPLANTGSNSRIFSNGSAGVRLEALTTYGGQYLYTTHTGVAAGVSWVTGVGTFDTQPWTYVITYDGTTQRGWLRDSSGLITEASPATIGISTASQVDFGSIGGPSCGLYAAGWRRGALSTTAARQLLLNPWEAFAKRPKRVVVAVSGGSGVSGTAAVTLGSDTSSATGTTTVKGSAAPTLGNDTSSATGVVGSVSGTAAITLGNDTSSAQGTTSIGGTGAVTLGNDTATASGAVGSAVTGTAAITLGNDTSTAQGTTKILGSAAITLGSDFSTTQGTTKILGSAAITLGDDFATAFGTSGTPTTVSSPRGLTIRIGLAL